MKRTLPFAGTLNPYLPISDLLEDTIIRVTHIVKVDNYFDGNLKVEEKELSYVLPLIPLLFEYFTPEEIRGNMMDGKPMFEMQTLAGNSGVKVTLRVPIKGAGNIRYVEYIRRYYNNRCADVQNNEGGMTEFKFTGCIMPQVRFNNEQDAIYTVSCVQSATGRNEIPFISDGEKILPKSSTCRNEDQQIMVKADNYL